jgi:hypothetical protein
VGFTSETARAANERRKELAEQRAAGVAVESAPRKRRRLEQLTLDEARELTRQEMQKLLRHKDPRLRREAAKYVLDEARADRDNEGVPTRIVYETRALPPTFNPRAILAEPPPADLAADA